jgi:methionine-S-sulfoxide reductase
VVDTSVGYAGGELKNPTYSDVKTGETNYVESVKVVYDETAVTFKNLLNFFFRIHDPTTENRQGNDVGTQYRSVVFYSSENQRKEALEVIEEVNKSGRFGSQVVTRVEPETTYYLAEEYHQKYLDKNPNGYTCHFIRD